MSLSPARWQQIASVYELVIDREPSGREALLCEACSGDDTLRREVEALLRRDAAGMVLDRPVWATVAALFEDGSGVAAGRNFASPKSSSLAPLAVSITLDGLRSR